MDIQNELQNIGLHKSEIKIYFYLLENGLSSPPQIAKSTKIARTNSYHILQSLKEKGLVIEQRGDKRKAYLASDPSAFLRTLEKQKEIIEQILPDLRGLYITQKNKPKIRFFDGWEQTKEIYLQSLSAQSIIAMGSTNKLTELDEKFFTFFVEQIRTKNIVMHDILSYPSKEKGAPESILKLKGLYNVKFLSQKHSELPTDMLIWDDNVALISLEKPIFGTIITNKTIAQTFKIMFDVMWNGLH